MSLVIHDTAARRKRPFAPLVAGEVRIYVCGPTVYDLAHIGNARPIVVFDTLVRLLRQSFDRVVYVRNITDVDDKINAAAREQGVPIADITARTTAAFHRDIAALNALAPDVEPRATDHIAGMIEMIATLIEKGHAYPADGHVLFDVATMPDYGEFAHKSPDELIAGARVDVAPYKKGPMDFVLWKPSDEATPGWPSPWGRGRPGWHIECSVMSARHLGITFDIHGGGQDLIFPHHQNEIAQSACAHDGAPLARYWMHNGYVVVEGEKMSKSLGNFFTVRDLLAEFPGEAIRLALLAAHYRQPLDFRKSGLSEAKAALDRWYQALEATPPADDRTGMPDEVKSALEDDLNTPRAIAALHGLAGRALAGDTAAAAGLKAGADVLGVLQQDPVHWRHGAVGAGGPADDEIEALIAKRAAARRDRDFAAADRIRADLAGRGIQLEDGAQGTIWRRVGGS